MIELLPTLVVWYSLLHAEQLKAAGETEVAIGDSAMGVAEAGTAEVIGLLSEESSYQESLIDLVAVQKEMVLPQLEPSLMGGVFEKLSDWGLKIKKAIKTFGKVTAQYDQWNSLAIVDLARQPAYREFSALYSLLAQNWHTFAAEFAKGELASVMQYRFGPDGQILGLDQSYKEDLASDRQGKFADYLETQGKGRNRAELEDIQLHKLKHWIQTAPVNELSIWTSPPGSAKDGYIGTSSYSFIFVYQKTSESAEGYTAKVTQMRTWLSMEELAQFQEILGRAPDFSAFADPSYALIDNFLTLAPPERPPHSNQDISQGWAQQQTQAIQEFLYQHADQWQQLKQLPVIEDEAAFQTMSTFLFNLYANQVIPDLLSRVPEVASETDPVWQNFLRSPQYKQLVKEIDIAFSIFAAQSLAAYVENTASNKEDLKQETLTDKVLNLIKKPKNKGTEGEESIATLPLTQVRSKLQKLYEIKISDNPSRDQIRWFNDNAGGLLSTNRLFSLLHCGSGTFLNTNMLESLNMEQLQSLNIESLANIRALELSQLTTEQKQSLLQNVDTQLTRIVVKTNKGHEVWFVPQEYLDAPGCYFSAELNCVVGPCGIPLAADPLTLSEHEYAELQASLVSQVEQELAQADISDTEKKEIEQYLQVIEEKVFMSSIGLAQLVSGNTLKTRAAVSTELQRVVYQIQFGWTNIKNRLKHIVEKYIAEDTIDALVDEQVIFDAAAA